MLVQNGPASLCNAIVTKFEERWENEKDHQSADLNRSIGEHPDLKDIIEKGDEDDKLNTLIHHIYLLYKSKSVNLENEI